jgi:hypothetical protein
MTASLSRTTALRAFVVGAPLAFAALLTRHPMGAGDFYTAVSESSGAWLAVHFGSAILFPLMALVVWLLIRDLPGRAAAVSRWALPVFAVLYGVWETMFGIANGMIARAGSDLGPAARRGTSAAFDSIVGSPLVGELSVFNALGSAAWLTAVVGAIVALKRAGVRTTALVLLGIGGMMVMHVPPIGPVALVCLSGAALLVERHRAAAAAMPRLARPRAASAPAAG